MSKLIYLKKFNEDLDSKLTENCTFEMFKDILIDAVDLYDYEFEDLSDDGYYCCNIKYEIIENLNNIQFELTNIIQDHISPVDEPMNISDVDCYRSINNGLDQYSDILSDLSSKIISSIEQTDKIKKLIAYIHEYVEPPFRRFKNFSSISVGLNLYSYNICITFEIKEEEKE